MKSTTFSLSDDTDEFDLGIPGLVFSRNRVAASLTPDWNRVISNTGYVVGHFVTHAPPFSYGEQIGLHVGQIDQLTFVSVEPRILTGRFIDCRDGSVTFGKQVTISFKTSLTRKLIVPCGVAHTFTNSDNVVTRNDLLLFTAASNPQWKFEDDLISLPANITTENIPAIQVKFWKKGSDPEKGVRPR